MDNTKRVYWKNGVQLHFSILFQSQFLEGAIFSTLGSSFWYFQICKLYIYLLFLIFFFFFLDSVFGLPITGECLTLTPFFILILLVCLHGSFQLNNYSMFALLGPSKYILLLSQVLDLSFIVQPSVFPACQFSACQFWSCFDCHFILFSFQLVSSWNSVLYYPGSSLCLPFELPCSDPEFFLFLDFFLCFAGALL